MCFLWFLVYTTPQRGEQGDTYLGRPWLGRLAGPGHSKGALSRTGLPGRQDASLTLCGLVPSGQDGEEREGGRGGGIPDKGRRQERAILSGQH